MPTVDELNAGFDVAKQSLTKLVNSLVPDHDIPFVGNLRLIALVKLQSKEARPVILNEVKQILVAAESARNKPKSARLRR